MFFVNGAMIGMWATQIPAFKERLGLGSFALSIILFMMSGGTAFAMAFSVWPIRYVGVANSIRVSAILFCGSASLIPLASGAVTLAIIVLLFGASGGTMNVAMNAHAGEVEKRAGRPYMSSFHGMWSLGGLAGAGSGALLMQRFYPVVDALAISIAMFVLFLWDQRGLLPIRHQQSAGHVPGNAKCAVARPTLVLGVVAAFAFGGEGVVLDWAAVYMRQGLDTGRELSLLGYPAFAGSMAVMRFAGDSIRRKFSASALVCTGALVAAFGLMVGPLTGHPAIMNVGCAITGAGLANIVPVLFSLAGALPRPDVQIAIVSTMGFAGLLAAPPLLGAIGQHYGLDAIFFAGAAGVTIIAILAPSVMNSHLAAHPISD
jgi:MFS family permease